MGRIGRLGGQGRLLQFGRESRLRKIDLKEYDLFWRMRQSPERGNDAFVGVSEEILRRFRPDLEDLWLL
jgi:hypothetical protein